MLSLMHPIVSWLKRFLGRHPKKLMVIAILSIVYYFCLPKQLFTSPTATVVESREGVLLGARIADDGQWRFPVIDSVPKKFETCLLAFEDAYFYQHPGFNPISMLKAFHANLSAGKTVRGGSTLTQQVIRLSRNQSRSYTEKLIELILATRLEWRLSKEEILRLYASHAPFGGNIVGLDVASWRYFGLRPYQLSWAEAATLAVLPNAPGLIYPGKNQSALLEKRNGLLHKLFQKKRIDRTTYELALLEPLPAQPFPLPKTAPHLLQLMVKSEKGKQLKSTIDANLQRQVNSLVQKHHLSLKQHQVHNAAVLILDVATREVLSYVGNTQTEAMHQKDVDMVQANRSTGSTLKPLLYTAMLDAGELLPDMLVADVPTQIAGYTPENFDEDYSGAVAAKEALARSLNVPAVRLLQTYGLHKFRDQLDAFELGGVNKTADHYGLTLILGGAESNLWDLCKAYATLAGTLNHFNATSSEYFDRELAEPILKSDQIVDFGKKSREKNIFDAASVYLTFEAMKEVNRPEGDESWQFFDSSKQIAWKTGTSFGNKDAWAIGLTRDHVVGIWVGNADGEGRPNVSGVSSAAPLLFDVFDLLPTSEWFQTPFDEFTEIEVCADSGFLASTICPTKKIGVPKKKNYVEVCHYHQSVYLDSLGRYRVNSSCTEVSSTRAESWFSLPPLMEFFYKRTHPLYASLPPFRQDCIPTNAPPMQFIYPRQGSRISLTRNYEGRQNELVLKLAHNQPNTEVYWYLDDTYLQQTKSFHEIGVLPGVGKHKITAIDDHGNEVYITITIE